MMKNTVASSSLVVVPALQSVLLVYSAILVYFHVSISSYQIIQSQIRLLLRCQVEEKAGLASL